MAPRTSTTTDKNIVDRTKNGRATEVARAVRQTRDRLAQRVGSPAFDRELLKLHARAIENSTLPSAVLVLVITGVGLTFGNEALLVAWCGAALVSYLGLAHFASKVGRIDSTDIDPVSTRRIFLLWHAATGFAWTCLAYYGCSACGVDQFNVVKAVILLVGMAACAIVTSNLAGALLATFIGTIPAYFLSIGLRAPPMETLLAMLLILSLSFFSYIASRMNRSTLLILSFRTQKDSLIAELETAKSISDEARRRAEEANLAKSRFLASMSHELRTPLNAILGFSEVMAKEILGPVGSPTYKEYAGDIHQSGEHLLGLINEILDLSRIEAGRYTLTEEPVDLAAIAEDCCHMVALRARSKAIKVVQHMEPNLPRLLADERAVRQVALNLLSNAIKFTPSGGEVQVRCGWTVGGGQYVSVKDNGPGIPDDEMPIVLSAFGQGSIAIKSAEQGTGLGLPIVQSLLAMHGGELILTSRLREGTEAIAAFPASRVMEKLPAIPERKLRNVG